MHEWPSLRPPFSPTFQPSRERRTAARRVERLPARNSKDQKMFDTVVKRLQSYRKYQETYRELSRLSPRELDDLGINRADITAIARRTAI